MNKLVCEYHSVFREKVAVSTFESDKYILPEFEGFLEEKGYHLRDVFQEVVESWIQYLQLVRKNSIRTLVKKVTRVKAFFAWLVEEGYLLTEPIADDFYCVRLPYKLRKVPSVRVAHDILRQADNSSLFPDRNRAILELCYSTGMRRGELYSLNVKDVSSDEVSVIGKGGRERIVPIGEKARRSLTIYIKGERKKVTHSHNPLEPALFLSREGERVKAKTYNAILKKQVKSPFSLHSFRHACATHMLKNGANIAVLRKLLGHEKLETTQKYTHVMTGDLKKMLLKCHPRG